MANYLLDTHALIWFFEENSRLPSSIQKIIKNTSNNL